MAQGILALMNNFCMGNAVNVNALLGLGLDGQVQMLLELAQLAQLQSLGFMNVLGAQNLIQSNLLFGNQLNALNIGASSSLLFFFILWLSSTHPSLGWLQALSLYPGKNQYFFLFLFC